MPRRFCSTGSVLALLLCLVPLAARAAEPLRAEPGPYGVGVRTVLLVDESRPTMQYGPYDGSPVRELPTEIWYPADTGLGLAPLRDAEPASAGAPFPLVVRAHGLGAKRSDSVYLTAFLASHGYVVAAPDFPLSKFDTPALVPTFYDVASQPGDLSFVIDAFEDSAAPVAFVSARTDLRRIAALGHSLGGLTVLLQAYDAAFRDDRLRAVAALAPWGCALQEPLFAGTAIPSLWMGGTADLVTPYTDNQKKVFPRAEAPKTLVTLELGTHVAFATPPFEPEPGEEDRSPDDLFCDGTFGLAGLRPFRAPKLPVAMGDEPEIDQSTCGNVCPAYDGAFMSEERQHELTRVAVLAFFDAELKGSAAAEETLVTGLAAEPDVSTVHIDATCGFGSCAEEDGCVRCGQPLSRDAAAPGSADALAVLRGAVGLASGCSACACDVNASLDVTALDAMIVLRRAVGQDLALSCLRELP